MMKKNFASCGLQLSEYRISHDYDAVSIVAIRELGQQARIQCELLRTSNYLLFF